MEDKKCCVVDLREEERKGSIAYSIESLLWLCLFGGERERETTRVLW